MNSNESDHPVNRRGAPVIRILPLHESLGGERKSVTLTRRQWFEVMLLLGQAAEDATQRATFYNVAVIRDYLNTRSDLARDLFADINEGLSL